MLIVEDDSAHAELLSRAFESEEPRFALDLAQSCRAAAAKLASERYDAVLVDLVLPDDRGLTLLPLAAARELPFVLMTSQGDESVAVEALQRGAFDYVVKSSETLLRMPWTLARVIREHALMTAHRRTVDALYQSEERLRTTLESLGDLVIGIDETGAIRDLHIPERFRPLFTPVPAGTPLEELVGAEIVPALIALADAGETERDFAFEVGDRAFIARASVCGRGGATCAIREVTARRRAERERAALEQHLQQAQRLETVGTLAGGLAHDINNLLVPIVTSAELVRSGDRSAAALDGAADQIVSAALQIRELARRLLTFGRQTDPDRAPLDLAQVVGEALRLARAAIPATMEMELEVDPNTGVVVASSTQLHQVVLNLVLNAHQASPAHGGRVLVRLEPITLTEGEHPDLAAGAYARLIVEDYGAGMERAVLERVFEPFFTTKSDRSGSGLGMSVVHGIVRDHGGLIRAESQPGEGTRIEVILPRVTTPARAQRALGAPTRGDGELILVVDDQPNVLSAQSRLLERLGYRTELQASPEEAIRTIADHGDQISLVLTDLTMPSMSGEALAETLRSGGFARPIVLLSGSGSTAEDFEPGLFDRVLPKPCDARTLGRVIRETLAGASE